MEVALDGVDLNNLLVEHYGSTKWTLKKLHGWLDVSFHAVNATGEEFTFKVFKDFVTSDIERIEAEIELITFLNKTGLPVPSVVPTLAGGMYGEALFGETARRFRLSTFIKGEIVDRAYTEDICRQFGNVAGLIDGALASFRQPCYDSTDNSNVLLKFYHYDFRKLIEKLPGEARNVARRYVEAYDELVTAKRELLPTQVTHNDLHGRNVLVNEDGSKVVGVIDFSDAMLTFRVIEPSIALSGILLGDCDHFKCAQAFLEHYVEHVPLNEAELAALPITVAGRLVMIKTMMNEIALSDPDHDRNSDSEYVIAPTWYIVERLLDKSCSHRKFFDDFAETLKRRKQAALL